MTSNARFAEGYVKDQLSEQHITFPAADALTDEESESACLVRYAGQALTTGKQAECYANDFIGLHLRAIADGQTFADLGEPQSALRARWPRPQEPATRPSPGSRRSSPPSPPSATPCSRVRRCAACCSRRSASACSA